MTQILVPVDFSSTSKNACFYAESLASIYDEVEITLLNVYHIAVVDPMMPQNYLAELADSAAKRSEKQLQELKEELLTTSKSMNVQGITIKTVSKIGFAAEEILDLAKEEQPDLLIIGTRHSEGMKMLTGSISAALIGKTDIPLIVVPERYTSRRVIDNVLYASNLEEKDKLALRALVQLVRPIGARIHCIHVHGDRDETAPDMHELKAEFVDEVKNGLLEFETIRSENTEEVITDYAERHNMDLLAMLTHKRSFFQRLFEGSISKRVALHADRPILIFQ